MSCEYRVFVEGKHSIGLNETKLGIIAPKWFQDSMINTIGYRQAELALTRGTLFTPQEALKIGLVDELASSKEDAIAKGEKFLQSFKGVPGEARQITKQGLRKDALEWLEQNREWDTTVFINFIQLEKVQTGLDRYVQSLKVKRS